ncbi:MAG: CDP-alcohol phosphatidyltransferase family protein, partial [Prosthecobacter sp.]|nr:CDP-alcohol phosphatidyltransferase family protein [Prosthecobacter sp.]
MDSETMVDVKTRRENNSILSRTELAIIDRVLPHIPSVITPDHLTYLGLAGACLAAAGFAGCLISSAFLPIAILGLFLNWVGDSFDGGLARYRANERPKYGFMIDHSVDLLSTTLILIGLGTSPYLPFNSACFTLIIYLLFCGFVYIKVATEGVHTLAFGGFSATEFRILVGVWALLIHVLHLQGVVNATFVEWHAIQ